MSLTLRVGKFSLPIRMAGLTLNPDNPPVRVLVFLNKVHGFASAGTILARK
ncbi:MAG: hypothetical protein OXC82_09620 [Rhodobacteraceae bacterium]|nr:hypothetical protein [Paracoccaceae bacterium]MCY4250674.1 hypothetical protein [Paracoccaceae bacterium]